MVAALLAAAFLFQVIAERAEKAAVRVMALSLFPRYGYDGHIRGCYAEHEYR